MMSDILLKEILFVYNYVQLLLKKIGCNSKNITLNLNVALVPSIRKLKKVETMKDK